LSDIYISFTQAIHILISNISKYIYIYIYLFKQKPIHFIVKHTHTHTHSLIYTHTHLCLIFSFICVDSFLSLESSLTLLFSFSLVPFFFYSTAGYTHREKERDTRSYPTVDSVKKKGKLGAFFWFKRKKGCWTADGRTKRVEKRFAALSFYFLRLSREVQRVFQIWNSLLLVGLNEEQQRR